jgi:hypothetical protein
MVFSLHLVFFYVSLFLGSTRARLFRLFFLLGIRVRIQILHDVVEGGRLATGVASIPWACSSCFRRHIKFLRLSIFYPSPFPLCSLIIPYSYYRLRLASDENDNHRTPDSVRTFRKRRLQSAPLHHNWRVCVCVHVHDVLVNIDIRDGM